MKIEEQVSKLIKPSVPTPESLRIYKIGFTDEIAPPVNIRIILFFPPNGITHNPKFLEKSLEKTLSRFYPFAGRYVKEKREVDCNDQGAEFIHAKVNVKVDDILEPEMNFKLADELMPAKSDAVDQISDPMLSIKVTMFECGGATIGVSISHRIADAATVCSFINAWAAMNRSYKNETGNENDGDFTGHGFKSSAIFPASHGGFINSVDLQEPRYFNKDVLTKYATKKLSFSESMISNIKAKAIVNGNNGAYKWSKVQVAQSIIWKAFIDLDRVTNDDRKESILFQPMNLREKTASFIPKHSCGNICTAFTTESRFSETTEELAHLIRVSIKKTINDYSTLRHDSPEAQTVIMNSISQMNKFPNSTYVVVISSWCNFSFYEADFGFGKPISITIGSLDLKNNAVLIDDVGGNGVEAFVGLEMKDVPNFEQALDTNAYLTS